MWCEYTLDRKSELVNHFYHILVFFMIEGKGDAVAVLERLMSSYSVNTQKHLAEELGIAANNISGWVQRNSVPGDAIVKCALDTGADLHWLVTGEFANASFDVSKQKIKLKGKALLDKILESGGKAVLRRMLDAYGFTTQKELGDLLDISSATISTWIRRDFFPGDIVVACALDTGVSLEWLATGRGVSSIASSNTTDEASPATTIPKRVLLTGKLENQNPIIFDKSLIPSGVIQPEYVESSSKAWLVDFGQNNISNGRWLLDIDGNYDVYDIARLPGNRISVASNDFKFECDVNDVSPTGVVIKTFENNF